MPVDEAEERLAALVSAARGGERAALEALLEAIERRVFALAYRLVGDPAAAEDVSQEALLKVCQRLGQYRGGSNFWAWVCRVVINQAHDYRRAAGARRAVPLFEMPAPEGYHPAREEQLRRVMEALVLLTEKERTALVLTDMEGFTSVEAARVLHCFPITVRTRAAQGRKKVRRALGRYYPELREAT